MTFVGEATGTVARTLDAIDGVWMREDMGGERAGEVAGGVLAGERVLDVRRGIWGSARPALFVFREYMPKFVVGYEQTEVIRNSLC